MTDPLELLKRVPLFADLPEADLRTICEASEERKLAPGENLFLEGEEGDQAYVIVDGEAEVLKQSGDREVLLAIRHQGEVIGEMALIEATPRSATVRAKSEVTLMAIRKEQLEHLLETSLAATRAMFYTILSRWRSTEAMLRQGEKMAQLGTLTAGVAHELNNPAAAVRRGADQISEAVARFSQAHTDVSAAGLSDEERATLDREVARVMAVATKTQDIDAMTRSDLEFDLENVLDDADVSDAWEMTSDLVNLGYDADSLTQLVGEFTPNTLTPAIKTIAAAYSVYDLMAEIGHGAGRISDIVKALKEYSYLDQAPVQEVDVHDGINSTLVILRSKLKTGVEVKREFGDLPKIMAHGSELNQVWTNIIDNAIDALDGEGVITLRTRAEGDSVVVEIEDNGPGIPEGVQGRVFDAFFTTKPPGKGTGLGLDITYGIVAYKHHGDISVASEAGKTVFTVRLPIKGD